MIEFPRTGNIEQAAKRLLQISGKQPTPEKIMATIEKLCVMADVRLTSASRARAFEYVEYYTRVS